MRWLLLLLLALAGCASTPPNAAPDPSVHVSGYIESGVVLRVK